MNPKDVIEECIGYDEERKIFYLKSFYSNSQRYAFDPVFITKCTYDKNGIDMHVSDDIVIELEHVKMRDYPNNLSGMFLLVNNYDVYVICHDDKELVRQCYVYLINKILSKSFE